MRSGESSDGPVDHVGGGADRQEARLFWLYGVIPEGQPLPGVGADVGALEAIAHQGIAALVEPVPKADFAADVLEAKLQSLEWVTGMAELHQGVLAAAMAHGPVIPARLATLFSSRGAVVEALSEGRARFLAALERVSGCREWGLKVLCDHRRLAKIMAASPPELAPDPSDVSGATPGLAYVLAKKREARAVQLAAERADDVIEEVLDALAPCAVETRCRPLLDAGTSGRRDAMELNLAALVEHGGEDTFRAAVGELAARFDPLGFTFLTSGPWAPYSFCDEEASEERAPADDERSG
jgi:Gas vesicle synthesis protein GvpL/GvpF